jgi:glycosyltransferase involved in cell wall biosynthesis
MDMAPAIPLSCYIRTLNEAKRIGPVIDKIREIGAEVIVVDSGSTDNTREIARRAGAKVVEHAWEGNGFQKRVGEEAASNDWLLDLDADEVLSPELQETIRSLFADGPPKPAVYSLQLVTVPPVPRGAVWKNCSLAWRNKLYHKSLLRMPAHAAWDQLDIPKTVKPIRLKGGLLHYSFPDIAFMLNKMNKVSSVRARETKLKPKGPLALRVLFGFPFYVLDRLIIKRMYKTGVYGFACAAVIASNRWLKDVKMYEQHLQQKGMNRIGSDND